MATLTTAFLPSKLKPHSGHQAYPFTHRRTPLRNKINRAVMPVRMATPPRSPPPADSPTETTKKKTRQTTRMRRLTAKSLDQPRPTVHVNPSTGRGSGPHKEKFHSYLGVVAREKIPIVHTTWKDVPETLKFLVWDDILGIRKKAQEIQKFNESPHVLSRGGYDVLEKKLMAEKTKSRLNEGDNSQNADMVVDPPSPIARHEKWKKARTNKFGQMTSAAAQEIADKIDELQGQAKQGAFVPHGRQDILNTAIGRPEHPGRVRVGGHGVTITSYFGHASCGSHSSSPAITAERLVEIIQTIKQEVKKEVEDENKDRMDKMKMELDAIKSELSQIHTQQSAPPRPSNPDVFVARVSTKESCAEAANNVVGNERSTFDTCSMGFYIVCGDSTQLVAGGKVFGVGGMIQTVAYGDDVVRVCVDTVYDGEAIVPLPTSEIQYVRDAMNSFIGWPRHLVKPLSYDSDLNVRKPVEHSSDAKLAGESDPLGELMKILFYVYQNPVEVPWEANQFGLPEIGAKFYITHADLAEIISGDKCLNIAILQLWTIFMNECGRSKADQSLYGLLEPQSIQNAKERRQQCQQYIETWVKESQRQLYLGAYLNQAHWQLFVLHPRENTVVWFCSLRKKPDISIKGAINSAMKTITSSFEGMSNQGAPRWVEPKTNVQSGGFECGYYVMHWMWCIVTAGLKDDWHKWFSDGSSLDVEAITSVRQKWATYFLSFRKSSIECLHSR
ncbi:hypothetical protein GmHk_05G012440 [Glycine max]|nr:hypothetical protein GmHk_05G012440 [Glycine max]